jgi:hypothetical protein
VGCLRTFPRSRHINLSYERAFGAYAANQEIGVAAQYNICAANQDTAEHSKTSVQPIRSKKIKQWRRDRPRSDTLVLKAAPASIFEYRLKNCLTFSASSMPPLGFQCVTHTAKRARQLRKQVSRLRPDQAAPQVALFVLTEAREEKD